MKILKVKCLAPTRLDNYLMEQFPALNPGRLNKALRENKIKLNGKKQPLSTRVMAGDEIKLFILDEVLDADKRVEGPAWKNARGPAQVVYDCPQILIVNKPAGLAVDGPEDDTLLNRALLYLNQQGEYKENSLYTPALCHRLDTGTSGLVIIAKTPEAEELFLAAIKNRDVQKTYLCVTFGRPTPPDATLGGYLLKDADRGIVKIVEDKQPGAKEVETQYETIAVSGRLALLKVKLITGRTHQIRAHMASIGCPILGDSKYGNNSRQPGAEAEVSGALCLGAHHAPLHPAGFRVSQRQDLPRTETVVLPAGAGWHAKIIFDSIQKRHLPLPGRCRFLYHLIVGFKNLYPCGFQNSYRRFSHFVQHRTHILENLCGA